MSELNTKSLAEQAQSLVKYCSKAVGKTHEFGNLTSTIYDTSWVAIVRKHNDTSAGLLFPESHEYIISRQLSSGEWESYDSEIDGIMNTLGGLLVLKRNADVIIESLGKAELATRTSAAVVQLKAKLDAWTDVITCDHVGFEIIIPSMLEELEKENIVFEFPQKSVLLDLNQKKLSKIHPGVWSGKVQTTLTHSLEAFLGKADFSRLKDQRIFGGMGASPSSTAAYLMSLKQGDWDEEAEAYIHNVINSRTKGSPEYGGVPGMYPTTGFEVFWIASTLLEDGFGRDALPGIECLIDITDDFYKNLGNLGSGFSAYSVPDADDTSKSIIVRNILGVPTPCDDLVKTFEGETHFLTYFMERHPSLTTNCNALSAILESPEPRKYTSQIEKVAEFLCGCWSKPDANFMDKWSISEFYPLMLMSEALVRLVQKWDNGTIVDLSEELLIRKVPLTLFQLLMYALQQQNEDGSWGPKPSREITAYAIIALCNLASLPFIPDFQSLITEAIARGRAYINTSDKPPEVEYVWIGKAAYSPLEISKAYIISGLKMQKPKYRLSSRLTELLAIPERGVNVYTRTFSSLPTLQMFPKWRVRGGIIEGYLFLKSLKLVQLERFETQKVKKDEYFEFIAMALSCANELGGEMLRSDVLFDMMCLILRVYHVDEYIEHVIGKEYSSCTEQVKDLIGDIFTSKVETANGKTNGRTNGAASRTEDKPNTNGFANGSAKIRKLNPDANDLSDVRDKLSAFAKSFLHHPSIASATSYDRNILRHELHRCLLSHILQVEDSKALSKNQSHGDIPQGSYFAWARTTAASHSCAPMSLAFLRCLLRNSSTCVSSAYEQYLVQDIWAHLSNKARMENDRGSLRRDHCEGNLNSLDFPEFGGPQVKDMQKKMQLSAIIEYEKRSIQLGLEELAKIKKKSPDLIALKMYSFLLNVYADVYAMKDISSEGNY